MRSAPLPVVEETVMRLVRSLIYVLTVLVGLYLLAAVLYAIPVVSGALDDSDGGEVRPSRSVDRRGLPQRAVARQRKPSTTSRRARRSCPGSC